MPKKQHTLPDALGEILANTIKANIKLDVLLNSQAELLAKANGTSEDAEFNKLSDAVSNMLDAKLNELGYE